MAITGLNADSANLKSVSGSMADNHGTLEYQLASLASMSDELKAALEGQAGMAAQSVFADAHARGKKLNVTLNHLIELLTQAGVKIDADDLDGKQRLLRLAGTDGVNEDGAKYSSDIHSKVDNSF
ncbi:WXG100 family type VII secretion target [Nocardia australiensis]|uniref:WXG100 family type VII secretion target n=1 Tax=Nocardia australiensis TaxID=2887191 RepID=UPI001D13B858|nr:WXG100 family type VII secretion target [Nocardia australiensis]